MATVFIRIAWTKRRHSRRHRALVGHWHQGTVEKIMPDAVEQTFASALGRLHVDIGQTGRKVSTTIRSPPLAKEPWKSLFKVPRSPFAIACVPAGRPSPLRFSASLE